MPYIVPWTELSRAAAVLIWSMQAPSMQGSDVAQT